MASPVRHSIPGIDTASTPSQPLAHTPRCRIVAMVSNLPRMSDHHRGRSRRGYYDDDYYYEERPRHRSLGRQALDKLEDAMSGLGLEPSHSRSNSKALIPYDDNHHHHHRRPSSPRRHPIRDSHWDRDHHHHHHRAYHSASPSRHHHHRHHSHYHDHRGRHEARRDHDHDGSSSRSRSRFNRGITAAVDAAALEAFRLRKEPGPWKGKKGQRIATAAISAGMIGAAAATDHSENKDHDLGGKGALGSAIGGLMVNRLVNGPRKEVRRYH
ncbi:hypothetical protein B0T16DRAFT_508371 [Cercophora newfieldiana]|uniref:Uncharacterized protein n=1 Tax=Cercophora newfieldiana TaxID=92897 RepID=A0AA40CSF8_9PEZI|nr:hypothetical protein B0T16DRAFT_508371 [Cercophora newfieldiana]